jgi:hypothetical protein
VVRVLQEAQEQVQELAWEQVRVLGLAAELVRGLVVVEAVAEVLEERVQVLAQLALVEVEELVEVLEPDWDQGPLVEL